MSQSILIKMKYPYLKIKVFRSQNIDRSSRTTKLSPKNKFSRSSESHPKMSFWNKYVYYSRRRNP